MARHNRAARLETRTARLKLPIRKKPIFVVLSPGIALGYRRNQGPGTWVVRAADGHGGQWTKGFAIADDHEEADGEAVQTWWQAQDRARSLARRTDSGGRPVTVAEALGDYARDLKARGGDPINASRVRSHLSAALLGRPVSLLTAKELRQWRDGLSCNGSTLNRNLACLKAALNHAAATDPRIGNVMAWRVGLTALPDTFAARNAVLPDEAVLRLVSAAWSVDPALGLFVEVAAVTGARTGQIARLTVEDLQASNGSPRLLIPASRKGRRKRAAERYSAPITQELAGKLHEAAGDRPPAAPLLTWSDGAPWERAGHVRLFADAAARAGLKGVTAYALRHSSIVRSLLANVPARVVAAGHDTSIAMIEKTYSRYISDHSDEITRRGLLSTVVLP